MFKILKEAAPFLALDILNELLLKIEHIPLGQYTHNTLKLIKKITITELDKPDNKVSKKFMFILIFPRKVENHKV